MPQNKLTMAQKVAKVASDLQRQRTGHTPKTVTVVLSEGTLVITLQGALTPAEEALARSPAGAAQVQEFHRQLFASSVDLLRKEIKRITGVEVREAAAEVETKTGTVVHAFTSGTMVQVFLLARSLSAKKWNGNGARAHHEPASSDLGKAGTAAGQRPKRGGERRKRPAGARES